MYEIKAWKADDGKMFESEVAAARYEAKAMLEKWFDCVKASGIKGPKTSEAMAGMMLKDADKVAEVLNRYIRARGPARGETPPVPELRQGLSAEDTVGV